MSGVKGTGAHLKINIGKQDKTTNQTAGLKTNLEKNILGLLFAFLIITCQHENGHDLGVAEIQKLTIRSATFHTKGL